MTRAGAESRDRALWYFLRRICTRTVSPGRAAWKCIRERRGRVWRPLFQILTTTALSGIFYGADNAHAVSSRRDAWKCMCERRGRLLFRMLLTQRGDRVVCYFLQHI